MIAFFAHFYGECNAIEQADRLFVRTVLRIRITVSANCNIIHARHNDDTGLVPGHVILLVFSFVIERHILLQLYSYNACLPASE